MVGATEGAVQRIELRATTLTSLYRQLCGGIVTVGVTDGLADPSFLGEVEVPILVAHPDIDPTRILRQVPTARLTSVGGSRGWDEAIRSAVLPAVRRPPRRHQ